MWLHALASVVGGLTGAPVVAFCRIDDRPIRTREPIDRPGALIVQDATLLHQVPVLAGLDHDGYLLLNSARSFDQLGMREFVDQFRPERMMVLPATEIAMELIRRPVPNVVLLGGFAALSGLVSLESVEIAIRERFSGAVADGNAAEYFQAFFDVHRDAERLSRLAAVDAIAAEADAVGGDDGVAVDQRAVVLLVAQPAAPFAGAAGIGAQRELLDQQAVARQEACVM